MLTLLVLRQRHRPLRAASFSWHSVLAGLLLATMSMLFILALSRSTAALVAFLQSASPFSGALFGWLLLRERVDGRTWAAMAVAVLGVAIMVGSGLEAGSATGVIFAALIPVVLGLYNVLVNDGPRQRSRRARSRLPASRSRSAHPASALFRYRPGRQRA